MVTWRNPQKTNMLLAMIYQIILLGEPGNLLFWFYNTKVNTDTIMILSFRTDRSWQTVQTQIRQLLQEQSDQGLHCLPSWQTVQTQIRQLLQEQSDQSDSSYRSSLIRVYTVCHSICTFWKHYPMVKPRCSNFRVITAVFWVSEFLRFLRVFFM